MLKLTKQQQSIAMPAWSTMGSTNTGRQLLPLPKEKVRFTQPLVDIEPLVDVRQLLHAHGVEIDEHVLRTMNFRFSGAVLLALQQQNADLALDAYMSTKRLPGPSTQAQWESLGIVMGQEIIPKNPELTLCFHNNVPKVIKCLKPEEARRQVKAKEEKVEFEVKHRLMPFEVLPGQTDNDSTFIMMSVFPATVGSFPSGENFPVEALWAEMKVALDYLHSMGFAHCDIKPENIFIDKEGIFLLGDHGSVTPFGERTQSTQAYVPTDFRAPFASAALDWWMLVVTLLEKVGVQAHGCSRANLRQLVEKQPRVHALVGKLLLEIKDEIQN